MSSGARLLGCLALSWSFLAACESDFRPYNEVEGFRLLAMTAEPPELSPGETVAFDTLITGDAAPSFRWSWCPVTRGPAEAHTCDVGAGELPPNVPSLDLGTSTTAALTWSIDQEALAALCALAAAREVPNGSPRLDCAAERPQIFILLELTSSGGEIIRALRPLELGLSDRTPNANPRIDGLLAKKSGEPIEILDGTALEASGDLSLELEISETAAEYHANGREILRATWFVEGGETEAVRTTFVEGDPQATFEALRTNIWTLPTDKSQVAIHLVIRDDRGGASFLSRRMIVEGSAP